MLTVQHQFVKEEYKSLNFFTWKNAPSQGLIRFYGDQKVEEGTVRWWIMSLNCGNIYMNDKPTLPAKEMKSANISSSIQIQPMKKNVVLI